MLLISGASGAGKSTLAAACAGLLGTLVPGDLQGTLRVGGVDLVAAAAAREPGPPATLLEQIGVILAGPAPRHALPRLADDVALALESRGVPAALIHTKVRAAITTAGLPDRAGERDVDRLSGGERALAAAATALVTAPALLIADEPFAGLDETRAAALVTQIATLQATRVLVSHELEPLSFATHMIHLGEGRVVQRAVRTGCVRLGEQRRGSATVCCIKCGSAERAPREHHDACGGVDALARRNRERQVNTPRARRRAHPT